MSTLPVTVLVLGASARGERAATGQPSHDSVFEEHLQLAMRSGLPVHAVCSEPLRELALAWLPAQQVHVCPSLADESTADALAQEVSLGIRESGESEGWILLCGDPIDLPPSTLQDMARTLRAHRAPVLWAERRGLREFPLGLGSELYSELAVMRSDAAFQKVLHRYPAESFVHGHGAAPAASLSGTGTGTGTGSDSASWAGASPVLKRRHEVVRLGSLGQPAARR